MMAEENKIPEVFTRQLDEVLSVYFIIQKELSEDNYTEAKSRQLISWVNSP